MMSLARSEMFCKVSPSRRSAAFCMIAESVEMPTVKMQGTSMRMFCLESALLRSTLMDRGVRSR